jgi:hypothetical protein
LAAGSLCIAAGLAVMALGPTGAVSGMSRAESEPFSDQACLDCHTDEDRLKELAVEEESPETLSSGPG